MVVENAWSSMLERLRAGEVMDLGVFLKVTPGPGLTFLDQCLDPQPELLLLLLLLVTSGPAQPLSCVGHANACGRNKHTNSTYWNTHTHSRSVLTCLHDTCVTITIVSRRSTEGPSLTPEQAPTEEELRGRYRQDGRTDRKRTRCYVAVVVWKAGVGDLGQRGQRSLLLLL